MLTQVDLLLLLSHVGREDGGEARDGRLGGLAAPPRLPLLAGGLLCEWRVCECESVRV